VSLTVGLLFANLLQPGHALNMALPEAGRPPT
jgi:Na+/H+-dicarboxylate symporter